jgi:hypothetical protein
MSDPIASLAPEPPPVEPIAFDEPDPKPNASEIVPVADSRFLFCDNNVGTGLWELELTPDGRQAGPLVLRDLNIRPPSKANDLEGITFVGDGGDTIVVAPSFGLKQRDVADEHDPSLGAVSASRSVLLRVRVAADGRLRTDVLPDFRAWLVAECHDDTIRAAADRLPDFGGLNVEAVGWDASLHALLFGVRTPVRDGRPFVLRVRVRDVDGPWDLANFEMLSPVRLAVEDVGDEQGIRAMTRDGSGATLVVVGNSTSESKAPFSMYRWDGNEAGDVERFGGLRFAASRTVDGVKHSRMKVEGVTRGTIGGRGALVFVDDGGGFASVWDDDPRARRGPTVT